MMRQSIFAGIVLAVALLATGAGAEDYEGLPNPLRNENLIATCQNMSAQIRAGDPAIMAALVGVWEGQSMIPGIAGLYPDTPQQVRATNSADGTYATDYYACFEPYGQMPACAQSFVYGEWTAHAAEDGWIAVPYVLFGSGYGGEALPARCGLNYVRLIDARTMVYQDGTALYRVQ